MMGKGGGAIQEQGTHIQDDHMVVVVVMSVEMLLIRTPPYTHSCQDAGNDCGLPQQGSRSRVQAPCTYSLISATCGMRTSRLEG